MPHWRQLIPSRYLKHADKLFEAGDLTATIAGVEQAAFDRNGKADFKALLSFTDTKIKPFGAGVVSCNVLETMFGADYKGWVGKTITMYVRHDIEYGGKLVSGIRIRQIVDGQEQTPTSSGPVQAELEAARAELAALKAAAAKPAPKKGRK